jgi:signal peptidase I
VAAILVMAAIGAWAVGTKQIAYVRTYGVSMNPVYYEGDLVFVARSDSYEVGQIAAYHGVGGLEVLHRIIGGDPTTGFVFKGDNNDSVDLVQPTADNLIGRAVLHIPKGGIWLKPFLSPTGLGMLGFLIISGGAASAKNRRDLPRGRRRKKVKGMAGQGGSWAMAAVLFKAVSRLHPVLRVLAVMTALCAVAGVVLGVLGWMKPATQTAPADAIAGESMTFSYSAEVERSAAYDGAVAYSPDPIYRKLAKFVDLQLQYQGKPGQIEVSARLAAQGGWHSTVQLSQARQFSAERYTGKVTLDLNGLQDRATAAGKAIGADLGAINLTVTARIRHGDGSSFEPKLELALTPVQFSLAGDAGSLVVDQSGTTSGGGTYPRQISVLGRDLMTAATARTNAIRLLAIAIVGIIGIGLTALRSVPLATRAQIQRRYGHLLVPIEPIGKQSEPVVAVATFPALVKLAEKYGQMILTWTRPDGADDFVVRDDGVIYRFRVASARPAAAKPSLSGIPHPARHAQKSAAIGIASVISNRRRPAAEPPEPPALQEPPASETSVAETVEPEVPVRTDPTPPEQSAEVEPAPTPEQTQELKNVLAMLEVKPPAEQPETAGPGPEQPAEQIAAEPPAEQPGEAQPTAESPVKAPAAKKVLELTAGPTADLPEPPTADKPEPPSEPTAEPTEQSAAEPTAEPAEQSAKTSVAEPTAKPTAELAPESAAEPAVEPGPAAKTRAQPASRSPNRRPAKAAQPTSDDPAKSVKEPAAAAQDVPQSGPPGPEKDPAASGEAGPESKAPRKRAAPRKPRPRKATPPKAEAAPKAEPEPTGGPDEKTGAKPEAKRKATQEAQRKAAQEAERTAVQAAERTAAQELATQNEAITRKAERDQAAADRARKERLARAASRDPAYDFLPRNQKPPD